MIKFVTASGLLIALFITVASTATQAGAGNDDQNDTLIVPTDRVLPVQVASSEYRMMVSADFIDGRILNNSLAQNLRLKRSLIGGGVRIGNVELNAHSRRVPFAVMNMAAKKSRVHWFDFDVVADADGVISASALPYDNVVFQFRDRISQDSNADITLKKPGNWGFSGGYGLLAFEGQEVGIGFSMERPETILSAGAGALFSRLYGGKLEGEVVFNVVRFGVRRPMRLMRFATPIPVASLLITSAYVRVSEAGEEGLPDDRKVTDIDEITVVANKPQFRPSYSISVGSTDLSRCASLIFKNSIRKIELNCH